MTLTICFYDQTAWGLHYLYSAFYILPHPSTCLAEIRFKETFGAWFTPSVDFNGQSLTPPKNFYRSTTLLLHSATVNRDHARGETTRHEAENEIERLNTLMRPSAISRNVGRWSSRFDRRSHNCRKLETSTTCSGLFQKNCKPAALGFTITMNSNWKVQVLRISSAVSQYCSPTKKDSNPRRNR